MSRILIVHKSGDTFLEFRTPYTRLEIIREQVTKFLKNFLAKTGTRMTENDFYFCLDNNYKIDPEHDKLPKKEEIWND